MTDQQKAPTQKTAEAKKPAVFSFKISNDVISEVAYTPNGFDDDPIIFKLKYMDKKQASKLTKKNTKIKFVNHQKEQSSDDEGFTRDFIKNHILGWSGMTVAKLKTLVPIESELSDDVDVPFNEDTCFLLIDNAWEIWGFLQESAMDLSNFRAGDKEAERKN